MKIGFTGTQKGMTEKQNVALRLLLLIPERGEFHMGLCIGADVQAAAIARSGGYRIIGHPPENTRKMGKFQCDELRLPEENLVRNRAIVQETEVLVATPKEVEEVLRSGTWATVRYARSQRRNVVIILPDGTLRTEKRQPTDAFR